MSSEHTIKSCTEWRMHCACCFHACRGVREFLEDWGVALQYAAALEALQQAWDAAGAADDGSNTGHLNSPIAAAPGSEGGDDAAAWQVLCATHELCKLLFGQAAELSMFEHGGPQQAGMINGSSPGHLPAPPPAPSSRFCRLITHCTQM